MNELNSRLGAAWTWEVPILWYPFWGIVTIDLRLLQENRRQVLLALILVVTIITLGVLPDWQASDYLKSDGSLKDGVSAVEFARQVDEFRRTLAQIIGGLVILLGVYLTWRRTRAIEEQVEIGRSEAVTIHKSQINERFNRAVEQLGNTENLAIRLGGIYALEQIAKDAPEEYFWTVMEVLAEYVREYGTGRGEINESAKPSRGSVELRKDIGAILKVIGRRDRTHDPLTSRIELRGIDLRYANLSYFQLKGVDLRKAQLKGADLEGADLRGAILAKADLTDASLFNSKLSKTVLNDALLIGAELMNCYFDRAMMHRVDARGSHALGANFEKTQMYGSRFEKAELLAVIMCGAICNGIHVEDAELDGADLRGVIGMKAYQLCKARSLEGTKMDDELRVEVAKLCPELLS
ncbi:pentapeptide repeat-containing protein [Bacteroidota bacterium]